MIEGGFGVHGCLVSASKGGYDREPVRCGMVVGEKRCLSAVGLFDMVSDGMDAMGWDS